MKAALYLVVSFAVACALLLSSAVGSEAPVEESAQEAVAELVEEATDVQDTPSSSGDVELPWTIWLCYAGLWVMAVGAVHFGSVLSKTASHEDKESMDSAAAWRFPLVGSAVLVSLYVAFKYLPKDYVNALLQLYFSVLGAAAVAQAVLRLTGTAVDSETEKENPRKWYQLTAAEVLAYAFGAGVVFFQAVSSQWLANNAIGLAFSVMGIELLHLESFKTGVILLSGLFFYDVFWVFGTDVMVTVAKSFNAPIKLLFPRDPTSLAALTSGPYSLLGLGDIVIPGIFCALCLRIDPYYYRASFLGYQLGLATTMVVMHVFRAAQPALLYLVPFCILMPVVAAVIRGGSSLSDLWNYKEESTADGESAENTDGDASTTSAPVTRSKSKRVKAD